MKVVSVINYKGGVGKTTLTACLASYLQDLRHPVRVLLVDLDAQCNLTCAVLPNQWKGLYPNPGEAGSGKATLREWYRGMCGDGEEKNLGSLILHEGHHAVIPSHLDLLDVDMDLAVHMSHPDPDKTPSRFVNVLGKLRDQLCALGNAKKFDVALLDCPPNFNIVTQTAIIASDAILVPVQPTPIAVMGINHLIRRSGQLVEKFNDNIRKLGDSGHPAPALKDERPKILGAVFTMRKVVEGEKAIKQMQAIEHEVESDLWENRGVPVIGRIRHNAKLFAENSPFDVLRAQANDITAQRVKNNIRKTCRNVGEALEVIPPSGEDVLAIILRALPTPLTELTDDAPSLTPVKAGWEIARAMRHLPRTVTDQFEQGVEQQVLAFAKGVTLQGSAKMAGDLLFSFWRHRGYSEEEAKHKRSEFTEQAGGD